MKTLSLLALLSGFVIYTYQGWTHHPEMEIIYDYEEGLERAKAEEKPVFLLFTGRSCRHNLDIQNYIQTQPQLLKSLGRHYVNLWLYVDDRSPLPEPEEVVMCDGEIKTLRTQGQKWAYLEKKKFGSSSQPMVVVLDGAGEGLLPAMCLEGLDNVSLEALVIEGQRAYLARQ